MTSCRSKTLLLQDHFLSHDKAFRALPSGFGQTATPHSNAWGIPLLQDLVRTFQRVLLGAQPHSDGLLDRCAHKDLNAPCCSSGSASLQFVLLSTLMEARWHTGVCTSHHVGQRCCMDDESSPVHGILSSWECWRRWDNPAESESHRCPAHKSPRKHGCNSSTLAFIPIVPLDHKAKGILAEAMVDKRRTQDKRRMSGFAAFLRCPIT